MSDTRISFKLKNDLSELDILEEKLDQFCEQLGLTNRCLCEINLALEELFTNIISYGYSDDDEHWVRFTLSYRKGNIIMEIEDDGMPFNPLDAKEPDIKCPIEGRKIGGLGIHLTKKIMDEMTHHRRADKNVLIMKKALTNKLTEDI
jgi:anti-sigma regulatory factor (Ser/Thr protein kinase)